MTDLKYDTSAIRAYAANLAAFYRALREEGIDRRDALAMTIAFIQAAILKPSEPS